MSSYRATQVLLAVSTTTILYQVLNGKLEQALLFPAVGISLQVVGEHFQLRRLDDLGRMLNTSSVIAIPGAVVGYGAYALDMCRSGKVVTLLLGEILALGTLNKISKCFKDGVSSRLL